ncbi:hypothetical protein ACJJTF_20900 (plasmid) [Bacillus velezensis]|uniref:hypothetical protein n=2 Tax=Bacillus subtilis group TaxID=653685 RepID=UPI0038D50724
MYNISKIQGGLFRAITALLVEMKKQKVNLMNNKPKNKQIGKVLNQFFEIEKRPLQIGFFVGDNNEIKFLNDVELNEVKSLNQKPQYVYSFEVLDSLDSSSDAKLYEFKIDGKTPVVFRYSEDISFRTEDGRKWIGKGVNIEFMKRQDYNRLVLIESLNNGQ